MKPETLTDLMQNFAILSLAAGLWLHSRPLPGDRVPWFPHLRAHLSGYECRVCKARRLRDLGEDG